MVPDLTTSTLSIASTDTGNPYLTMSELARGFTLSREHPLYLEEQGHLDFKTTVLFLA